MLASIVKFMGLCLGLSPAPHAGTTPAVAKPDIGKARKRQAGRRSAPRSSPLAARHAPCLRRPSKIGPHATGVPIFSAPRRPKVAAPAPKRTPRPRHVWLEPREPAARRAQTAVVIPLPIGRKPVATPGSPVSAAA